MERLTLYTHATNLDYLHMQLAEHYGSITQTGPLDWLAVRPPLPRCACTAASAPPLLALKAV